MLLAKLLLLAVPLVFNSGDAQAKSKFDTIYTLPCSDGDCPNGADIRSTLVADGAGNLYGTTLFGGAHANGSVFEMAKTAHGYKFEKLYDFCAQQNCADGGQASSGLVVDVNGNLYGVTVSGGGANNGGNIYKLMPAKHDRPWKIVTLYDFCGANCENAYSPIGDLAYPGQQAGQLYDGVSSLYGATFFGGASEQGSIYRVDFLSKKKKPKESIVYSSVRRRIARMALTQ